MDNDRVGVRHRSHVVDELDAAPAREPDGFHDPEVRGRLDAQRVAVLAGLLGEGRHESVELARQAERLGHEVKLGRGLRRDWEEKKEGRGRGEQESDTRAAFGHLFTHLAVFKGREAQEVLGQEVFAGELSAA